MHFRMWKQNNVWPPVKSSMNIDNDDDDDMCRTAVVKDLSTVSAVVTTLFKIHYGCIEPSTNHKLQNRKCNFEKLFADEMVCLVQWHRGYYYSGLNWMSHEIQVILNGLFSSPSIIIGFHFFSSSSDFLCLLLLLSKSATTTTTTTRWLRTGSSSRWCWTASSCGCLHWPVSGGSAGIILRAPSLYDMREPIGEKLSEIPRII